jgi:hypothetical protein
MRAGPGGKDYLVFFESGLLRQPAFFGWFLADRVLTGGKEKMPGRLDRLMMCQGWEAAAFYCFP